jgi:hypothetical protein
MRTRFKTVCATCGLRAIHGHVDQCIAALKVAVGRARLDELARTHGGRRSELRADRRRLLPTACDENRDTGKTITSLPKPPLAPKTPASGEQPTVTNASHARTVAHVKGRQTGPG